jgi:SAM-dependent methyltransferase/uncharacterized protein YbaR (Trm112 family)
MRTSAIGDLTGVGADAGKALSLTVFESCGDQLTEGVLRAHESKIWYPVVNGIPCFLQGALRPDFADFALRHHLIEPDANGVSSADDQTLTNKTFSDKWRRFRNYGFEPQHREFLFGWYCRKFGVPDRDALAAIYRDCKQVLEVGPGSGFNTHFIASVCSGHVYALDMSDAAFTTYENTRDLPNCTVVQADLMDAPFRDDFFDIVIADGVLHHTPDTRLAMRALYAKVRPGGRFFFYVYKRMGAMRQFCDQYIREAFTKLPAEECYQACEGLTELGRELSRLNVTVTLDKPIPVLGIPAGTHDIQRLLYYNFVKCFWNEAFDYQTNNMVNFDWYHPRNAWQHTEDEVRNWLAELEVVDYSINDANPNGISVFLTKPGAQS